MQDLIYFLDHYRILLMTLDQLEVLKIIIEKGSFRAASTHLNRAQSAVSYAVKELERDWAIEIFDRSGYRPSLTPAGQRLFNKAQVLLDQAGELSSLASSLSQGTEPHLRIAVSILLPTHQLTSTLKSIRDQFPQTQITLEFEILSGDQRVLDNQVDVAITDCMENDGLEKRPITKVAMKKVCAPSHPLAQASAEKVPRELKKYSQIIVSQPSSPKNREAGVVSKEGNWRVPDFLTKREFIRNGFGWGNMPVHTIHEDLQRGLVVPIGREQNQNAQLYLVYRVGHSFGPVGRSLIRNILQIPKQI